MSSVVALSTRCHVKVVMRIALVSRRPSLVYWSYLKCSHPASLDWICCSGTLVVLCQPLGLVVVVVARVVDGIPCFNSALPPMQPRYYSFVNTPLIQPKSAVLALSLVDVALPTLAGKENRRRRGVCSHYLAHLCQNLPQMSIDSRVQTQSLISARDVDAACATVHVRHRPSLFFHLPEDPLDSAAGYVMVGPGTGVAPFVGFLQHLQSLASASKLQQQQLPESWLFFGCRSPDHDFIYRNELLALCSDADGDYPKPLSQLALAYSRASPDQVIYVQNRCVCVCVCVCLATVGC
jgi:sulfite reductase alpha subunit-like flavoprotein